MDPTTISSRVTRQTAKKLLENAEYRVWKEVNLCLLRQDNYRLQFEKARIDLNKTTDTILQITEDFNKYMQQSNQKYVYDIQNPDASGRDRTWRVGEFGLLVQPLSDLHRQAMNLLGELMLNLYRTQAIINSIESRMLRNRMTLVLEELENVEYPDYLWAENNFHPNFFDFDDAVNDLRTNINEKKKIYEKHISEIFSGYGYGSSTSTEPVPGTSQDSLK